MLNFYYTFIIILIKSYFSAGFIFDESHSFSNISLAINAAKPNWYFYYIPIAFILSFGFLFEGRKRVWFFWGVNTFFSFVFLVDIWYLRGFNMFPSIIIFKQLSDLHHTSQSIFSMGKLIDSLLFIDLLIIFYILKKNAGIFTSNKRNILGFVVLMIISLALFAYIPIRAYFFKINDNRIQFYEILEPNFTVYSFSPIGYHVLDIFQTIKNSRSLNLSAEEKSNIQKWINDKREINTDNKYKGIFKGKNLIVIQVESLEKFVINQQINGQEITPNLNSYLKNSLFFSNFHEQVNEGTTSDAELMLNTSVYPLKIGSTFFSYPYTKYNSLPILLQNIGYSTKAIHADKPSFWNWKKALTSIGFEECVDSTYFALDESIGMGLSDRSFFEQSLPIIQKQKRPFFNYLITITSHGPFNIPTKYRELNLERELEISKLGGYFQSIHYTDKQIGIFIKKLNDTGLLNNTVVVIYGDHEGPHKYYQSDIEKLQNKEDWWENNGKKVPLIIYNKNMQSEEIKTMGGQIDLLPTICYLMGVNPSHYLSSAIGRNLLNTNKSFVILQGNEYVSDNTNEDEKQYYLQGPDISEKIIRSNYFSELSTNK